MSTLDERGAFTDDTFLAAAETKLAMARYLRERLAATIGDMRWGNRDHLNEDDNLRIAVTSDFASCMLVLHTVQGTIAQFLNAARSLGFSEDRVSVELILKKGRLGSPLVEALQRLKHRTAYVAAFANFSKHQQVVVAVDAWNTATGAPHVIMVPERFSWKGRSYDAGDVVSVADRDIQSTEECARAVVDVVATLLGR